MAKYLIHVCLTKQKKMSHSHRSFIGLLIFSCDQTALWMIQPVRLSVCLYVRASVCQSVTPFWLWSHYRIIFRSYYQWQEWCPYKKSRSWVKGQGHRCHNPTEPFPDCNSSLNSQMMKKWYIKLDVAYERCPIIFQFHPSNFKVTRNKKWLILTLIERFLTVTLVRIHRWLWNDAQSLMQHRRGARLFSKVIHHIFKVTMDKGSSILTRIECFRTVTPVWIHRGVWDDAQSLKWYKKLLYIFLGHIHQSSRSHGLKNWRFLSNLC